MFAENKQNERRFDEMLKKALKEHREPVRREFARRLLAKILTIEQQKELKKVIWQERILLAACILLPVAAVILGLVFPNLLLLSLQLPQIIYLLGREAAANMARQWQLWMGYAAVAVIMIYAVYEVLLADN
jgi:ribosomal protein L29